MDQLSMWVEWTKRKKRYTFRYLHLEVWDTKVHETTWYVCIKWFTERDRERERERERWMKDQLRVDKINYIIVAFNWWFERIVQDKVFSSCISYAKKDKDIESHERTRRKLRREWQRSRHNMHTYLHTLMNHFCLLLVERKGDE